jgi:hypothetical protein
MNVSPPHGDDELVFSRREKAGMMGFECWKFGAFIVIE